MKTKSDTTRRDARRGERGAALITALLLSTLLLVAGGALILTTSAGSGITADATAEMQAYYAAEAGLQAAIGALRGQAAPSTALSGGRKMDFRVALTPADSNAPSDPTADARLSRWLPYDGLTTAGSVVRLDPGSGGCASGCYGVIVADPYNSNSIGFSTTGQFVAPTTTADATTAVSPDGLIFGARNNTNGARFTLTFEPRSSQTLTAYPAAAATNLGTLRIGNTAGSGVIDFDDNMFTSKPLFRVRVNQTAPRSSLAVLEGRLRGRITLNGGAVQNLTLILEYLTVTSLHTDAAEYAVASAGTPRVINLGNPATTLSASVTAKEPKYLLVQATGFGPRMARKQMRALVSKAAVTSEVPATITPAGGNGINFNLGSSNSSLFLGLGSVPAVATSSNNTGTAQTVVDAQNAQGGGPYAIQVSPSTVGSLGSNVPAPGFLQSPDAARAYLNELRSIAQANGRLFSTQPATSEMGTATDPRMTFIDNYNGAAVSLGPGLQGTGLLVVTGNLETNGQTDFNGLILVLGRGSVLRDGGGNGVMAGAIVIANFDPQYPSDDAANPNDATFGVPTFINNGTGTLTMRYDLTEIEKALKASGRVVLGVQEN